MSYFLVSVIAWEAGIWVSSQISWVRSALFCQERELLFFSKAEKTILFEWQVRVWGLQFCGSGGEKIRWAIQ